MIEPDKDLVRRLRTRVRATPETRDPRRIRIRVPWYQRPLAWSTLRFLVPVAVLVSGSTFADLTFLSWLLLLWTTLVTLQRAQFIANALQQLAPLTVFYALPVSNLAVFNHQSRLILRGSFWLGLDWLTFASVLAAHDGGALAWLTVPVVGLAQWSVSLGLALVLVRWKPHLPYGSVAAILWFVGWIGLQFASKSTDVAALLIPFFQALERYSPAGWIARAGADAAHGSPLAWLILLGIAVGAWGLIRPSVAALRARFSLERLFGYDESDPASLKWTGAEPPADSVAHSTDLEPLPSSAAPTPVDLSAVRAVLKLELTRPPGLALFQRGAIERFITRRLTERQRVLVDFLQPQGFGWSRCWLIALGCVVVAHLLLVAGWRGGFPGTLAGGGVALLALPVLGGSWAGFSTIEMYQSTIGLHSLLPVGFWEIARTRLIIAGWRCVLALPLIYLDVAFGFTASPLPWDEALAWTLLAFVSILSLQPIWVFLAFSKTTNDASSRWWFTAAIFFVLIGGLVVLAIGFIAIAATPSLGYRIAMGAFLLAYTHGALALYGFAYHRPLFDLIGKPSLS